MLISSAEDALQSFVLLNIAQNFVEIDEVLYFYRQNPNSITNTKNIAERQKNIHSHKYVINTIKALTKENPNIFSKAIASVFINLLTHMRVRLEYNLKKDLGKVNIWRKMRFYTYKNLFPLKKKIWKKMWKCYQYLAFLR